MQDYRPYSEVFDRPHDFVVEYRFLTAEEGGRYSGPPFQGYRSDFWYEHENHEMEGFFMIYPEFLDESGEAIIDTRSRVPERGRATMWILNDNMREYHQSRIVVGTSGFFMEGNKRVATCIVTGIDGLVAAITNK